MTNLQKGLILAAAQLALVASVAAKYALDRARLPRVWVQTVAYDPSLPIRGRYLSLRLRVTTEGPFRSPSNFSGQTSDVTLTARDGHLVARPANHPTGLHATQTIINPGAQAVTLAEPVAFFLPEHAIDPSVHRDGDELWMEVSVPKTGAPRPIQLAVKRGGIFMPLDLK